jgi:hypothetical protein
MSEASPGYIPTINRVQALKEVERQCCSRINLCKLQANSACIDHLIKQVLSMGGNFPCLRFQNRMKNPFCEHRGRGSSKEYCSLRVWATVWPEVDCIGRNSGEKMGAVKETLRRAQAIGMRDETQDWGRILGWRFRLLNEQWPRRVPRRGSKLGKLRWGSGLG